MGQVIVPYVNINFQFIHVCIFFIVSVAGEVFTGEPGPRDRTTRDRKDDQERKR